MTAAEELRFWEMYAQLAPVLLIALLIEARVIAKFLEGAAEVLRARERFAVISFVFVPLVMLGLFEMHAVMVVGGASVWPYARLGAMYAALAAIGVFVAIGCLDTVGRAAPEVLTRVFSPGVLWWTRQHALRLFNNVDKWISRKTFRFVLALATAPGAQLSEKSLARRRRTVAKMARKSSLDFDLAGATMSELFDVVLVLRGEMFDHSALVAEIRPMQLAEFHQRRVDEMRRVVTAVFR